MFLCITAPLASRFSSIGFLRGPHALLSCCFRWISITFTFQFFLNYQQHKVGISCSHFLSFVSFIITARKRSLGQGNIFSSMCQEFCLQGGSASVHAGILHPLGPGTPTPQTDILPWSRHPSLGPGTPSSPQRKPPWTRHLPWSRYPPVQCMLGDTVIEWVVCILLECNLVFTANYYL